MSNPNHQPGDNKEKWHNFFGYVLAGGAANCQKAFDTLCEIGHEEQRARTRPEEVAAFPPLVSLNNLGIEGPSSKNMGDVPTNPDFIEPMNLNKCAHCVRRGHYLDMFLCEECENNFHPGCVSENLPRYRMISASALTCARVGSLNVIFFLPLA